MEGFVAAWAEGRELSLREAADVALKNWRVAARPCFVSGK